MVALPAASLGIRLIDLDRPGIGRSDPQPGFQILLCLTP